LLLEVLIEVACWLLEDIGAGASVLLLLALLLLEEEDLVL
jgi:hypothetical protein